MLQILYFFPKASTFVFKDLVILNKTAAVTSFEFNAIPKWKTPWIFLQQFIFILRNRKKKSVLITQFGGYHSLLPTLFSQLFKNKHFIILGGTDCNWLPSINYGNFNKNLLRWCTYYSLKNSTHLVPVNKELVYTDYTYTHDDFPHQGYKYFFPDISTPYTVLENGIDLHEYILDDNKMRRLNSFLTVCSDLQDERRRLVKGIDLILNIAKLFTDCTFTIVGGTFPSSIELPTNIYCLPFVENSKLPDLYRENQFYLQLSLTEGFPNTLIEAMACGCQPIVSNVGAMSDIIGDTGYLMPYRDEKLLFDIIHQAIKNYTPDSAKKVRLKAEQYDINFRSDRLTALINGLL